MLRFFRMVIFRMTSRIYGLFGPLLLISDTFAQVKEISYSCTFGEKGAKYILVKWHKFC